MGKLAGRFEFHGDRGRATVEALVDSGASVSLIRRDVAEKLSGQFLNWKARNLRLANGQQWLTASTIVTLGVVMKGKALDGSFYVVETMPREVIIGVDFMQKWEISLHPKKHDFTIGVDPNAIEIGALGG
jgi:hypothetical protein